MRLCFLFSRCFSVLFEESELKKLHTFLTRQDTAMQCKSVLKENSCELRYNMAMRKWQVDDWRTGYEAECIEHLEIIPDILYISRRFCSCLISSIKDNSYFCYRKGHSNLLIGLLLLTCSPQTLISFHLPKPPQYHNHSQNISLTYLPSTSSMP